MGRQSFLKFFSETFVSNSYYFDQLNFLYHILKINITMSVGCMLWLCKKYRICSTVLWIFALCLLGERTDKPTCKKNICKAKNGQKLALKMTRICFKGIQYNHKTFNSFVSLQITSSGWSFFLKRQRAIIQSRVDQIQYFFHKLLELLWY